MDGVLLCFDLATIREPYLCPFVVFNVLFASSAIAASVLQICSQIPIILFKAPFVA